MAVSNEELLAVHMKLVYMIINKVDIKTNGLFKANVLNIKGQTYNLKCI